MNDWFRSWHGAPTDPKWRTVAKRASVAPHLVVAVAWALMDRASQSDQRGSIDGMDIETLADFLGCDGDDVERIIAALHDKGILSADRFVAWERRQPKHSWDLEAIRAGRLPMDEWFAVRARVFARDIYTCAYCGVTDVPLECDHVVPVSRGGTNDEDNLVASCVRCNREKGDKPLSEWRPGF